jgi:hypothetical protein
MQAIKIYVLFSLCGLIQSQQLKNLFKGCIFFNNENFDCSDYIHVKKTFPIRDYKIKSGHVDSLIFRGNMGNLKVPDNQFFNLNISSIRFSSMGFLEISKDTFQNISFIHELEFYHIENLSISQNAGEFRPLRWKLRKLKLNRIDNRDLSRYITLLKMLNTVKVLQMSYNNLTYIPDLHFMNHLEKLELGSNSIKHLHIYQLGTIHFHENLASGSLPKTLKDLEMPDNLVTKINNEIFKHMDNLVKIDLSNNKIEILENYTFDRNNMSKNYEVINLNQNPIYKIEKKAFCSKMYKKPIKVKTLAIISDANGKVETKSKKELFNSCLFKLSEITSLTVMFVKCDCYTHLLKGSYFQCDSTELCNKTVKFDEKCAEEHFSCELTDIGDKEPVRSGSEHINKKFTLLLAFTIFSIYFFSNM